MTGGGRLSDDYRLGGRLADQHLVSGYEKENCTGWAVLYPLVNLAFCTGLYFAFGWQSVVYLLASALFFTGFLNPYCLGWVLGISHFHGTRRYQPTASSYGRWRNLISFNAGLHVEHHDLMSIPARRLGRLREIAPEFYNDLETIGSYTLLGLQFVFAESKYFEANFNHQTHRNAAHLQQNERHTVL